MTTDRDFDVITTAWLAAGPDQLPDRVVDAVVEAIHVTRQRRVMRVPWRFPTMTIPARVAAAAGRRRAKRSSYGCDCVTGRRANRGRNTRPARAEPRSTPSGCSAEDRY